MKFIRPKIIISKCLEFDACRYDGQIITNKYIKELKKYIDFEPVCPEVEIGMGIPRDTIRIVELKNKQLLYQPETKKDFGKKMNAFSNTYLNSINSIDGFILKADSPSCGISTAKIYPKKKNVPASGRGSGFFAKNVLKKFPNHPAEEEKRLNNIFIREKFYTSIFTLADFRSVFDINTLYKYHAKHKYLFMTFNQIIMAKMGNIAANRNNDEIEKVIKKYYDYLIILLSKNPRIPTKINTIMHVLGYFKKQLNKNEKKHFLESLDSYKNRRIPLSALTNILYSWIIRFDNKYLMNQSFFNPFPKELIEEQKSRFE
tara:strand:- start:154 stop:1101 length:948 start_codon:yes stop_codon:yes gene_type:complete